MSIRSGAAMGAPAQNVADTTDYSLQTADADGVKQSFAVPASTTVYDGAALDGAAVSETSDGAGYGPTGTTRNITLTLSATTGGFDPGTFVTVTGGVYGSDGKRTEVFELPEDGGVVLTGIKGFAADKPLSVEVEGQDGAANPGATITVGVGVARAIEPPARWVWANETGDLVVKLWGAARIATFTVASVGPQPLAVDMLHDGSITNIEGIQ